MDGRGEAGMRENRRRPSQVYDAASFRLPQAEQKEKFPVVVSVSRECISELNLKEPLIKFEEKRIKDSCVGFWKN